MYACSTQQWKGHRTTLKSLAFHHVWSGDHTLVVMLGIQSLPTEPSRSKPQLLSGTGSLCVSLDSLTHCVDQDSPEYYYVWLGGPFKVVFETGSPALEAGWP